MDEAYQQHSHHARRKNRSSTNLNHLTLAPLTTKLPLDDDAYAEYPPPPHTTSYLQGKSAPTTPGLLTRSPDAPTSRRASLLPTLRSLSTRTRCAGAKGAPARRVWHGVARCTPAVVRRTTTPPQDDSGDWLLRAGVALSSEAREYKGQTWLTSRASSTSLAGGRDAEEEAFEREFARERELAIRQGSRRGSVADLEPYRSARGSRQGSRSGSRVGRRSQLMTPLDGRHSDEGYFDRVAAGDEYLQGPDFVNLDEKLEAVDQDTTQDDEAAVRQLVKGENAGRGSWFGWALFSVEENAEDSDLGDDDIVDPVDSEATPTRRDPSVRYFEIANSTPGERVQPPNPDEGGWRDAAWLLSVASKVIL
ncbi:conserved hypothetical protein [Verticillium alfalfae VaMs.102]|uniref:DUF3984 domain-containing protein n=1 Tax=Verticillium alfalfae (strain VaMs.102 / ATCC MYA-4576 / FGSC 10136) TaxID=526221 RepID=C9SKD9_VERA1|nr:conserved hypothetical protein [Verticillium alfalfae VaMs.102]EEY19157.1 conserved hypothetical protein [Verticillium alfalfae VaMs.102]